MMKVLWPFGVRAVLDALEPVAYHGSELVHAGHGEIVQAPFDV
jgi:hypothetical protein